MKQLARSYVWWPLIDESIEKITKGCLACLENARSPAKTPLTPWIWPPTPWHRLHADFLGPFFGRMYLIIVDAYSKWPEAYYVKNITAETIIPIFRKLFSVFGYPLHLVTDNGRTFVSQDFQEFCKKSGKVSHLCTSRRQTAQQSDLWRHSNYD